MCWMGPMLPRMGEWAGHLHLHGHEGSAIPDRSWDERKFHSPTLQSHIITDSCSPVLRGSIFLSLAVL